MRAQWKIAGFVPPLALLRWQMRAPACAIAVNFGKVWTHATGLVSRAHALALADQAMVNGTGFLTTLLLARWTNSGQLGIYVIGISVLMCFLGFQDSLILEPYLIQQHSPRGTPAEHAGAFLIINILFAAGSASVLAVAAMGILGWGGSSGTFVMTCGVAGALPFVLTRELARRIAFARLEIGRAFLLDATTVAVQLSALGALQATGRMSALSACAALGGANATAVAGWLYFTRSEVAVRMRDVPTVFKQIWALAKWLLAGRITVLVQGYVTYWITMVVAGAAATGVYAACMSIMAVANPLVIGLGNVLMPKLVLAWKNGGAPGLWHEAIRSAALIGAPIAALCVAVFVAGEPAMHLLYHGTEYEGHGETLSILALATLAGSVGGPAYFSLATMARPRPIVVVGIIGAVLSVVLIWSMMREWGLFGAACGYLAGNVAGTGGRWLAFFSCVRHAGDPAAVIRGQADDLHASLLLQGVWNRLAGSVARNRLSSILARVDPQPAICTEQSRDEIERPLSLSGRS